MANNSPCAIGRHDQSRGTRGRDQQPYELIQAYGGLAGRETLDRPDHPATGQGPAGGPAGRARADRRQRAGAAGREPAAGPGARSEPGGEPADTRTAPQIRAASASVIKDASTPVTKPRPRAVIKGLSWPALATAPRRTASRSAGRSMTAPPGLPTPGPPAGPTRPPPPGPRRRNTGWARARINRHPGRPDGLGNARQGCHGGEWISPADAARGRRSGHGTDPRLRSRDLPISAPVPP